ncbi:MAG: glycosyltransferase family 2 protein [Actinomycetales bacterium]
MVIPHYNYGAYLPAAVDSARAQSGLEVDVVIVDDKSTDGSIEVAEGLAQRHENVELLRHETNRRHIATYNDGLASARGEYVALVSADDLLARDALTRAVALMEAHREVGLVYGAIRSFTTEPTRVEPRLTWWQTWSGAQWLASVAARGRNLITSPEVVMRRRVLEATGGYDPRFPHAADLLMWLRAAECGDVGYVGGAVQAHYRVHATNMHTVNFGGALDDMTQVRDVFDEFFARESDPGPPGPGDLRLRARHSLAREAVLRGVLLAVDTGSVEVLQTYRDFAIQTSPDIVDARCWAWADLTNPGRGKAGGVSRRAALAAERVRWALRSRRQDLAGL